MKHWILPAFALLGLLASPAAAAPKKKDADPALTVAGVTFAPAPKNWSPVKPANQMRAAQWTVAPPKPEKDAPELAPGEVVVFYFGPGQGGGPKDNLERWRRLMTAPDGSQVQGEASQRDVAGMRVHEIVLYGTYAAGMPRPGFKPTLKPNQGFVGVVIETSEGNVFLRFTGPKELVKAQLADFEKWLDTAKKATGKPEEEKK